MLLRSSEWLSRLAQFVQQLSTACLTGNRYLGHNCADVLRCMQISGVLSTTSDLGAWRTASGMHLRGGAVARDRELVLGAPTRARNQ